MTSSDEWRSMEEFVRDALEAGQEDLVIQLIRMLSPDRREKYRRVWNEVKKKKGTRNEQEPGGAA